MSAYESLHSKVFDPVRDSKKERIIEQMVENRSRDAQKSLSEYALELNIDASDAFDYENSNNTKYNVDQLKQMLLKEIQDINAEFK